MAKVVASSGERLRIVRAPYANKVRVRGELVALPAKLPMVLASGALLHRAPGGRVVPVPVRELLGGLSQAAFDAALAEVEPASSRLNRGPRSSAKSSVRS